MHKSPFVVQNVRRDGLTFDGCDTRKDLAFDGFEQSTAARRNVRNLVGHAELVDTCYAMAREPAVKLSNSNTPAGPFHRIVLAPLMASAKAF